MGTLIKESRSRHPQAFQGKILHSPKTQTRRIYPSLTAGVSLFAATVTYRQIKQPPLGYFGHCLQYMYIYANERHVRETSNVVADLATLDCFLQSGFLIFFEVLRAKMNQGQL